MIFRCQPTRGGAGDPIVVSAPNWFDARRYASRHFSRAPEAVEAVPTTEPPTVELRWVGSDYSGSRSGDRRHLEVRRLREGEWTENEWSEWEPIEQ